jgi:hypothetical protein
MHIHLDPVGGIAGDMFVAALLDAFPDQVDGVLSAVRLAGLGDDVVTSVLDFGDGVLVGKRFDVRKSSVSKHHDSWVGYHHEPGHVSAPGLEHLAHAHERAALGSDAHRHDHAHGDRHDGRHHHDHDHHHDHGHGHHHDHTHWAHLREHLSASQLPKGVKRDALGIFGELAWAEAKVHGKEIDTVTFHEVGNWDSIADIVAAATLIDALPVDSWSVGSLPIGQGRVRTAHGELPVPAPATTLLLDGFVFHHDGRPGDRVTPTGAAILRYLAPSKGIGTAPRVLRRSGHGFGTRKLPGMSNILRALVFDVAADTSATADTVGVIQFEVDDQSSEDLAVALDQIRASTGVIDVTQAITIGKKGRMMAAVQVLVRPAHMDEVIDACFRQTTTLGVRTRVETRRILARKEVAVGDVRVKVADRPGGATAKAESDDVAADADGYRSRSTTRRDAESKALKAQQ